MAVCFFIRITISGGEAVKTVLWVSRHAMTPRQEKQLYQIYGDIRIQQLDGTFTDAADIAAVSADIYAVVLPVGLLAALRRLTDREIIIPVSGRVPTGRTVLNPANGASEPEYAYDHLQWQRILRLELESEILSVPEDKPDDPTNERKQQL